MIADLPVPPTPEGSLGIVVVNYGSHGLLAENLAPADAFGPDVRVVVVDNRSTAEETRDVEALGAARGWHVVPLPENVGFGAGTNAGVDLARRLGCVAFLCLNPDARISPGVVDELRRHCLEHPMSLVSPLIVDSTGQEVFAGSWLSLVDGRIRGDRPDRPSPPSGIPWLTGACLAAHSRLWDRIGGFADDYFLYWEDVDLSHRAREAGGRLDLRRDLRVVHDEGGTQRGGRGRGHSPLYYRYNCRNRLVFAARNLPARRVLRWILSTPAVSWEVLLRGGRRQLVRSPRPGFAALRGSAEGVLIAAGVLLRRGLRRAAPGPGPRGGTEPPTAAPRAAAPAGTA